MREELAQTKAELESAQQTQQPTPNPGGKPHYTVKPWRLEFVGDEVNMGGTKYFWCTGDHWSGGVKHNGMYCTHKTEEHDAWRKEMDAKKSAERAAKHKPQPANPSENPKVVPQQKLGLSESLRTALCTNLCMHAGLSSEVADRIIEESNREAGNA